MKVFLDTNIIVDILSRREPFFEDSYKAFSIICEQNYVPCVSASAVTDIVYILRKYIADKKQLHLSVQNFLKLIAVLSTTEQTITNAFLLNMDGYEDAVQLQIAMENQVAVIVTRNEKDFPPHLVSV